MIKLNKDSIVYVLCPAGVKTGGPELLHQLSYKLNGLNIKSYITYYETENAKKLTVDDFQKYVKESKVLSDVVDDSNNVIVFPETCLEIVRTFKNVRKAMWWESVDNYVNKYEIMDAKIIYGFSQALVNIVKRRFLYRKDVYKYDYHLCQSQYAINYLEKKNIKNNVYFLGDYINDSFMKESNKEKKNQVLYNPKKGYKFTQQIINESSNLNWIPIQGLTTDGVRNLLQESKVYIDFGNHPGKDRFPREAAMSGCCIITGKNGSAANDIDVPIDSKYKYERKNNNVEEIIKMIKYCLDNYEKAVLDFESYKQSIKEEEQKFENDIKNIFKYEEL